MTIPQHYHHMKHVFFWELDILQQQCKYKNYSCKINMHIFNIIHFNVPNSFQKNLDFIPTYCSTIIINKFNIDILMIKTQHNQTKFKIVWIII